MCVYLSVCVYGGGGGGVRVRVCMWSVIMFMCVRV